MTKIKTAVIGTGHLGNYHTKFFAENSKSQLIGVYDKDEAKANEIAERYSTKVYPDMDKLIDEADALSIVASTSAHYEIAKKAIEKGKHILVEKPITATIQEAEEIVGLAEKNGVIIQVGHIERFNPALLSLEKYSLDPMFIQTDRLAQFNPRGTDVAVVLDLMIHDIDIILSLIKSKVKDIKASGVAVVSDTIDIANARIEFENGAVANVTASRISQKKMRKMRMFQRDNYISVDFGSGVSEVFRLLGPEQFNEGHFISFGEIGVGEKKKQVVYEQPELIEVNALEYEINLFIDAVINNSEPVVSGRDGLRALVVADKIIKKIEEVKIV